MSGHARMSIATPMINAFIIGTDFTGALLLVPAIESELSANITITQWVLNNYSMTFSMFMVSSGRLGDMHGRKRLMLVGLVIFVTSAAVCQFAPTVGWLIGARAAQGIGAAMSIRRQGLCDRLQPDLGEVRLVRLVWLCGGLAVKRAPGFDGPVLDPLSLLQNGPRRARLPGDDVPAVIIQDRAGVEPAPARSPSDR